MGQIIQAKVEEKEWMKRSYVGYLNETIDSEDIKNCFFFNGANFIRLRYLGDNVMLLTPEGETKVEDMIKENKEWLEDFFDDIRPWDNSITVGKQRVWVKGWGIPFHLWEWSVFVNTVINIGNLFAVDKITENYDELQYARLLDEDVFDYDNAKEIEKLISTSSKAVAEMNPEISLETMLEGRYDSPMMREPLKSCSFDTMVLDSTSQDNGYKTPTDMIHVSPKVAQTNGPNKTQAQGRECAKSVDEMISQDGLDSSTLAIKGHPCCSHEYGPNGGERHQWEDKVITISGTTKGIETKDAKNDRVIKGKEVVQPTPNPDIAWNHLSLINQTNINPNSFLQRSNMLIGESSRKR
ncbi:hypothetical protein VNO80_25371 [Phaseolus coccineus]|uniref:DUF4283 domain-containing protein n=1 Tax=Phaseolus coccineus TaxID=3886 RepID=A0AAN9LU58_PHACN